MGQQYSKVNDDNILFYLQQITQDDKEKLFDLISTDQEHQAIQLTCELINRERRGPLHLFGVFKVPKSQCNHPKYFKSKIIITRGLPKANVRVRG